MPLHWSHLKNLMFNFYKTIILRLKLLFYIKGTLKQIWKSPTVFVSKWKYPEHFAFLILRILKLSAPEICKFLKKYANFYIVLLFVHFFCNFSHISCARISKRERFFNAKSSAYYFMWRRSYWQTFKSALSFRIKSAIASPVVEV